MAEITRSWLLDLLGPKRRVQSAIIKLRQVTFQFLSIYFDDSNTGAVAETPSRIKHNLAHLCGFKQ